MENIKKIIFGILKFIFKSTYYACFVLGATCFVAFICFLNGVLSFDFEIFSNSNPEELRLLLKQMIRAFYMLGMLFTTLKYGYKDFLSEPCEISIHKLEPLGKAKEVKKGKEK